MSEHNFFHVVGASLAATDPDEKMQRTRTAWELWQASVLVVGADEVGVPPPGRPSRPALVRPRDLAKRGPGTVEGRAVLFHALTHIEFTAINLALDHAVRFRNLPHDYYADWLRIAVEEVDHFELLRKYLRELGYDYGDFPAHGGLWEMAENTTDDPLVRMALVPRCLEARGLDVNTAIKAKLLQEGDTRGAALLDLILRDEVGHVAAGDRWFRHLCTIRALDPVVTYRELIETRLKGGLRGPFHLEARRAAGFNEDELIYLQSLK